MKTIEETAKKHYEKKIKLDKDYTYEKSLKYVRESFNKKQMKKINEFNKDINLLDCDNNKIPKIIHVTCKDKNNITNPIWIECLNKIKEMYHDYKIIIYDNNDIYNMIEIFDKKKLDFIKKIVIGATLADVFRYLILYLRGGYYFDLDCMPIKHINKLNGIHFHGDNNNKLYLYAKNNKIVSPAWDFYENPCKNYHVVNINDKVVTYKCLGHKYINENTNIITGYEFDRTWNQNIINNNLEKKKWVDNNIGICQWFIASKPNQSLFLHCYKKSVENLNNLELNKNNPNYHFQVINASGPLFFTKMINKFIKENHSFKNSIAIFPTDFFCCGSGGSVPYTKNTFIKHLFTGTWLK
jgi:mannosyltransferase OCH1-like enzyme